MTQQKGRRTIWTRAIIEWLDVRGFLIDLDRYRFFSIKITRVTTIGGVATIYNYSTNCRGGCIMQGG